MDEFKIFNQTNVILGSIFIIYKFLSDHRSVPLNVSDESESKENIEDVGVSEIVKECKKCDLRTLVKVKRGKETEYTINYDGKHENHH